MDVGLLTDGVGHLSTRSALDFAAELGLQTVELAAGNWSEAPHLDLDALLGSPTRRRELLSSLEEHGLHLSALNASGNQLHPTDGERNDALVRKTIRLAGELGVGTVVLMSGLPGAPGDSMPNWITTSWPPETTRVLNYQWEDVALPYWEGLAAFAESSAVPRLAVEMHANQLVYSVPGLQKLRAEIGPVVGANFDPSHLLWMDADPLEAIRELGSAIFHVHAKDTRIEDGRRKVRSRLETLTVEHYEDRAWNYVTVGQGQPEQFWAGFIAALGDVGYDGTLSIEHEDASVAPEPAIRDAARLLQRLVAGTRTLQQP